MFAGLAATSQRRSKTVYRIDSNSPKRSGRKSNIDSRHAQRVAIRAWPYCCAISASGQHKWLPDVDVTTTLETGPKPYRLRSRRSLPPRQGSDGTDTIPGTVLEVK
ncbi:hypothetical protein KM043_006864 [Ampulex compressa]|nr:hypothetical protein KM043_006864 [Ampulex compressa]